MVVNQESIDHREIVHIRLFSDSALEAVAAKAGLAQGTAEGEFGGGVFCAVGAHHPRDGLVLRYGRAFVADVHCGFMISRSVLFIA
jgi:hypothetical protein